MSKKKGLTREPQIIAAVISVIGTLTGTLLISVLLGVMEGRIGLGALVGVVSFLLIASILVLLGLKWGLRLAGAAAAVMVILGSAVFLIGAAIRSIPSSAPGTTPIANVASPTPKQGLTSSTSEPTSSPSPAQQCRIVFQRDGDIYIKNCDDSGEYRLTDDPAVDSNPAWSPDGQRIVFSSQRNRQPTTDGWLPASLYVVNADGSNLTRLTYEGELAGTSTNDTYPDWSPDGSQIAFHRNCDLAIVKNDGSNLGIIMRGNDDLCADNVAWSPDGQHIALASAWFEGQAGRHWTVYVINTNGTGLLQLQDFEANNVRAVWSPDGKVGMEVKYDGGSKYYLVNADAGAEPAEVPTISAEWYPDYWPKWGILEEPAPSVASAEDTKAFAEPILAAIAGRDPTWSDDFSDPKSGWAEGEIHEAQSKQGYSGGEYYIQVSPDKCETAFTDRMPEFADFVLEIDGRFDMQGTDYWQVHFRHTESGAYSAGILLRGEVSTEVLRGWWEEITPLAALDGPPVLSAPRGNHLQIIAKGPSIALAVNGEPLFLVHDEHFQQGSIILVVCNKGPTSPTVYFDNLKIWDISGLSL